MIDPLTQQLVLAFATGVIVAAFYRVATKSRR